MYFNRKYLIEFKVGYYINMKKFLKFISKILLLDIIESLLFTAKQLGKSNITVQYPEEVTPKSTNFRGLHVLQCHPNGEEKCVACKLCETICPAQAITIKARLRENDQARRAEIFNIDLAKCMFCGLCQEVCPVDAIVETYASNYHFTNRESQILHKKKLLSLGEKYTHDIIKDQDVS